MAESIDLNSDDVYFWESFEEAFETLQRDASQYGFGIAKRRSRTHKRLKGKLIYVELVCDRSTTYKESDNKRVQNSSTVKTACPWKVVLRLEPGTERVLMQIHHADHNHEHTRASSHSVHRKNELKPLIQNIANASESGETLLN